MYMAYYVNCCHLLSPVTSFRIPGFMIKINVMTKKLRGLLRTRKWRAANPEKNRENGRKWAAANPEKIRENTRKWRAANPEKAREQAREQHRKWAAANPEKHRAASHKRRCRIAGNGGIHTAEQFKALCAHFGNRCVCCGRLRKLEADHVISVKMSETFMLPLGFLNDIDNLQPLCRGCNNKKRSQWLRHKAFVDYRTCPHADCISGREAAA